MIGWDFEKPFTLSLRVEPEHIDGLEHTNNAVYVNWCEQVAWAHSESLGLDLDSYRRLNRAMVITRSEFDYLRASRLGDVLEAATWIVDWDGKLTMERRFQIRRPVDNATVLRARMRFACVELDSGRPRRLPGEFVASYGPAVIAGPDTAASSDSSQS